MELLVCNKIISLDLPVKEVYKKIWCAQANVRKGEKERERCKVFVKTRKSLMKFYKINFAKHCIDTKFLLKTSKLQENHLLNFI